MSYSAEIITDISEKVKQAQTDKRFDALLAELQSVNARLAAIEELLKKQNESSTQTYIK